MRRTQGQPGRAQVALTPERVPWFHCPEWDGTAAPTRVQLDALQARHGDRVLRLGGDEPVAVTDGRGTVGTGTWHRGGAVSVTRAEHVAAPRPTLEVATAVPKGPRADLLVDWLSQLGADRLIPLRTERSIVHPRAQKLQRFETAALTAARQCHRARALVIDAVTPLQAALEAPADLRLLTTPAPGLPTGELVEALRRCARVLILVGPEGGWTPAERRLAASLGCNQWRLSANVLRIEAAAATAVAIARFLAESDPSATL